GKESPASSREREVTTCSAMSIDTLGTADCLIRMHDWKPQEARIAARRRQHVIDSTRAWQLDSSFSVDSVRHRADLRRCKGHDMAQCLTLAGWSDARAKHAADSVWERDRAAHSREVGECARRSRANPASCLMLSYRWDADRAQAAGDSVMRSRMVQRR